MARPSLTNPRKRRADTQEEAWVADEDRFVLEQAKKKAALRVKAGRARPIDILAVALRTIDPARNGFAEDDDDDEAFIVSPENAFVELGRRDLEDMDKDIDTYLTLEKNKSNHEYWKTMQLVCRDRLANDSTSKSAGGISAVAQQLDKVLGPKSLEQLEILEKQVKQKLGGDEAIDVDYWENLLLRLNVHKARAQLHKVTQAVTSARLRSFTAEQIKSAEALQTRVSRRLKDDATADRIIDVRALDPDSMLKRPQFHAAGPVVTLRQFNDGVEHDRARVAKAGYIAGRRQGDKSAPAKGSEAATVSSGFNSAYDREVARGLGEDEVVFATEEVISVPRSLPWADKYLPRKPRHFNRVQMGFEWNKYNQTHYDQDNPPPKVVQGYNFNVFYPDLVDKTKAPSYRIERENGRKRGETLAPAGEEDMCIIRFTAGAPYEDIAFRIVDREWDYSAKSDRGFKSSFDRGILQLHFQFKKVYYRK